MLRKAISLAIIIFATAVHAQWTSHCSSNSFSLIATTNNGPVAANQMCLFVHNLSDNSLLKLDKTNHLSDIGISAIAANGNLVFLGYSNGNIDFVDLDNYTTTNIPELKNYTDIEDKQINDIYCYNSQLICSTNCGIIIVDIKKGEIKSRYQIDFDKTPRVNCTTVFHDSIYAATNTGLFRASIKSKVLENNQEWSICGSSSSNFSSITSFNDTIITTTGTIGNDNNLYKYSNNSFSKLIKVEKFRNIQANSQNTYIFRTNAVDVYDSNWTCTKSISRFTFINTQTTQTITGYRGVVNKDNIYIASNSGLVESDLTGKSVSYASNSPSNNYTFRLLATPKGLFCTGGNITSEYNNSNRNIIIHSLINNIWSTSTSGQRDAINIVCDPNNTDSIYFSTWGNGIFKFDTENNGIDIHYTAKNSTLADIFGGDRYTRTSAISYDNYSNLFICQAEVAKGIAVKSSDNKWSALSYPIIDGLHSTNKMIFTSNDNGWVIIPLFNKKGLFVFNTNNTLDNDTDDLFRGPVDTDDSRDQGMLKLWDQTGEIISNVIFDIAEDLNGTIWLATDDGIVTFDGDKDIFTTAKPVFNKIKIPRNDGTNLADYLLDGVSTTAIAVDGANRKWIGTRNKGVYLLSADGTETIHHFTPDNSPLISDEISSIAVMPTTGEVFFATPLGLVSYAGDAIAPAQKLSSNNIKIWPNPVKTDFTERVKMSGFTYDCSIKITDINGHIVYTTKSLGGLATWNCNNLEGTKVSTGVYLVWAADPDGKEKVVSKILVVK